MALQAASVLLHFATTSASFLVLHFFLHATPLVSLEALHAGLPSTATAVVCYHKVCHIFLTSCLCFFGSYGFSTAFFSHVALQLLAFVVGAFASFSTETVTAFII